MDDNYGKGGRNVQLVGGHLGWRQGSRVGKSPLTKRKIE